MEPEFDAAIAVAAKHAATRAGEVRVFDDPEQQELLEIACRLRVAGVGAAALPSLDGSLTRQHIRELMEDLLDLLFPGLFHSRGLDCVSSAATDATDHALASIRRKLPTCIDAAADIDAGSPAQSRPITKKIVLEFLRDLPCIQQALVEDARAAHAGDPAARCIKEVLLAYPGFIAVATYRLAHRLHTLGAALVPRMMSAWAHTQTGIDIHPGASLGSSIFIDHGTGVVVGETAVVGNNVKLYHGVTLGAASTRHRTSTQRHPTIQSNVTLYAHATVLGGTTVIGENSVVGASVLLAASLPPDSSVTTGRLNVVKTRAAKPRTTVARIANRA